MTRICRRSGFTLIELLVVIAIIAILVAILLPVIERAQMAGKRAACQNNIKQLSAAMLMYCEDTAGKLPPADPSFHTALKKHVKSQGVYVCPSDAYPRGFKDSYESFNTSYGMNGYLFAPDGSGMIVSSLGKSSRIVCLFDITMHASWWYIFSNQKDDIDLRHDGMANLGFLDGHVKAFKESDIQKLEMIPSHITD